MIGQNKQLLDKDLFKYYISKLIFNKKTIFKQEILGEKYASTSSI